MVNSPFKNLPDTLGVCRGEGYGRFLKSGSYPGRDLFPAPLIYLFWFLPQQELDTAAFAEFDPDGDGLPAWWERDHFGG